MASYLKKIIEPNSFLQAFFSALIDSIILVFSASASASTLTVIDYFWNKTSLHVAACWFEMPDSAHCSENFYIRIGNKALFKAVELPQADIRQNDSFPFMRKVQMFHTRLALG